MAASVRVGPIIEGGALKQCWALPLNAVEEVDGTLFFLASRSDRSFASFLGLDLKVRSVWAGNSTLDFLCELKNKVVEEIITGMWAQHADPLGDTTTSPNKRARRELTDRVPEVLEITIPQQGQSLMEYKMRVLTQNKRKNEVFAFEITSANFEHIRLLTMSPPTLVHAPRWTDRKETKYSEEYPDVRLYRREGQTWQLRVKGEDGQRKTKCVPVSTGELVWKQLADEAAQQLQEWYDDVKENDSSQQNAVP